MKQAYKCIFQNTQYMYNENKTEANKSVKHI
jgi:hypothetical protein